MKYTEKDLAMFRSLRTSPTGKWLLDYLERVKVDMFRPGEVTKENVDAKNESIRMIEKEVIEPIKFSGELGAPQPGEYE